MKAGWEVKNLGEVCEFKNGLWKGKKPPFRTVGVIRNTNFNLDGQLDTSSIAYIEVEEKQFFSRRLNDGDIILEKSGGGPKQPVGRVVLFYGIAGDFSFSNFTSVIRIKDLTQIVPRFLHQYLHFIYLSGRTEFLQRRSTGIRNLDFKGYQQLPIPLPPLPEQKRIVSILDEAFAAIDAALENAERNRENARLVFDYTLNATFQHESESWNEELLGNLCSIKHGFAFKSKYFVKEGNYILLTPGHFYETGGFRDQGAKTKFYKGPIPDGYLLKKDDFLFAMTEQAAGLLGSTIIIPESNQYLHNQRLGLIQVKKGVPWSNEFFFHQFNSIRFRNEVQKTASGAKVRHTSPVKLGAISVRFPNSVEEQMQISARLDVISAQSQRLSSVYERKIADLNELKQSLLKKAFAGELTDADTPELRQLA